MLAEIQSIRKYDKLKNLIFDNKYNELKNIILAFPNGGALEDAMNHYKINRKQIRNCKN